jgi:hypothetical protein
MATKQTIFDGWYTLEEMAAKWRDRFGHGSADAFRRWKREGRLEQYGLEFMYAGRTPLVRQKPEMKEASSG